MYRLGHCDGDVRLEEIISQNVEAHRGNLREHFESDAGGHIHAFLNRNINGEERSKLIYIKNKKH
jgi:hypothetical protein